MRHALSVSDWRSADIRWILSRARAWKSGEYEPFSAMVPRGAFILESASLRTRIAYEGALHLLKGHLTIFKGGVGTRD